MIPRLLTLAAIAAAMACAAPVSARLIATGPPDMDDFEVYGLEQLTGRYGMAYPGYENWGQQQQLLQQNQNWQGADLNQNMEMDFGLGQQGAQPLATYGSTANQVMPAYGSNFGVPSLGSFGGVGSFGAGAGQLGASKKTTTAQPIYAQSMVVPKIITQPILRPHSVTQPILQQQLIQQPIVETRQVIQPVIRRIITQPIIRPEIFESTTIQPTLKTETTVQPHIIQQTVVTPTLMNQYEEQAPIQEAPKMNVQAPVVQPTISAKKQSGGLGYGGF